MSYLLDANVFIAAKNLHYGFDFCPAFWEWLVQQNKAGKLASIDKVGDEVLALADDLSDWAKKRGPSFFRLPDETIFPALSTVAEWANTQKYEPAAVSTFLQVGDYYLVAQALAGQHTIVTHEVPSASTKRIKIPDACIGLKVKCMTPYVMLRVEHARFVLGSGGGKKVA